MDVHTLTALTQEIQTIVVTQKAEGNSVLGQKRGAADQVYGTWNHGNIRNVL
jgi:hypothetical protein